MGAALSMSRVHDWRRAQSLPRPASRNAESPVLVSMVRSHDRLADRDRFACDRSAWNLLLEVAVSFGWKQRGTTYLPSGYFSTNGSGPADPVARHDYQPGDARDPKCVDSVDAIAWAAALSAARRSPHLEGMLAATLVTSSATSGTRSIVTHSAPFVVVMDHFIEYAFGGAFSFARAEEH